MRDAAGDQEGSSLTAGALPESDAHHGEALFGWFGGILEGRASDPSGLRGGADAALRDCAAPTDLTVTGGRFSLLLDSKRVDGQRLTRAGQDSVLSALHSVVKAAGDPSSLESTLRSTIVYADHVIETLFVVQDGSLAPVSRKRARQPDDTGPEDHSADQRGLFRGKSAAQSLLIAAAIAAAAGLVAWQSGAIAAARDAFFATEATTLETRTGVFGDTLDIDVTSTFGHYEVSVARGATFPRDAGQADALVANSGSVAERAAMKIVTEGGPLWVRVEDSSGMVLDAVEVDVTPLLVSDHSVTVAAASKAEAARVTLDITGGPGAGRER